MGKLLGSFQKSACVGIRIINNINIDSMSARKRIDEYQTLRQTQEKIDRLMAQSRRLKKRNKSRNNLSQSTRYQSPNPNRLNMSDIRFDSPLHHSLSVDNLGMTAATSQKRFDLIDARTFT